MTHTGLTEFNSTVQKSMEYVSEVSTKADIHDKHKALQALRGTLMALRDRMPIGEAVHLGAQLPTLLTGFYYEGWKYSKPEKDRTQDEFLDHIREYLSDVDPVLDAEHIARAVFTILNEKISDGEIEDILKTLPEELQDLWPEEAKKT